MKIIELLTKIANEEAPKNIKYNDTDYYLFDKKSYLTTDKSRFFDSIYFKELNDEVEIIEEDKKIEKLNIELNIDDENKVNCYTAKNLECDLAFKINEIIDYINKENK